MQLFVISLALLVLARADYVHPDGGACEDGQTCCQDSVDGYKCCPSHQAECCEDHIHCCPEGTLCMAEESSCVNATASIPWIGRGSAKPPGPSKSFRMIKSYMGEDENNVCPDQSRCPAEFSCLRAFTRFGCCPLVQGVLCLDGKHCCPEDHQCSADSRSCVKIKEPVSAVLCPDKVSECPNGATCCETPDGSWGCCPIPKAVCCEDKLHCCPNGRTCDLQQSKCVSSSNARDLPMWAKFPARRRAEWEKEEEQSVNVIAQDISDNNLPEEVPEITAAKKEVSTSPVTQAEGYDGDVRCDHTMTCEDHTTCCKRKEESWACCPLPEAVCCVDGLHCCPRGRICNMAAMTCDWPWLSKVAARPQEDEEVDDVICDPSHGCPDNSTCCKTGLGDWSCCPLPESSAGMAAMVEKVPAFTTTAPASAEALLSLATTTKAMELQTGEETDGGDEEEEEGGFDSGVEEGGNVQCDPVTSCPPHTTCCFMTAAKKWGCCPLPDAVCCPDGEHCCPAHYRCDVSSTSCSKGEVGTPWYNKLPALNGVPAALNSVECDAQNSCPQDSSCCQLSTGQWSCCPLHKAVCCPDKEHCCPQGYSCHLGSCQKLIMLQLQMVPLTRLYVPGLEPKSSLPKEKDVHCEGQASCKDRETCCRTSAITWGCCNSPNAVCCSDLKHCCPAGYSCTPLGACALNAGLSWDSWHVLFSNRKPAHIV